jgi:chromosomal replication initiation ATPase DnaA
MSTTVPTFDAIINKTAAHFEIPPEIIRNKEYRTREVTQARHIAAYIARKVAYLTHNQISVYFDQKRENISLCVRRIEKLVADDPNLMNRITGIITDLKTG